MVQLPSQEERIQSLANILSLVAIVGGMDKAAVQRVLIALGSNLLSASSPQVVDSSLAAQLLAEVAREEGQEAALRIATDMDFVGRAWQPVLDAYFAGDPHRLLPYAEILFALFNHSGSALNDLNAFERFGGADLLLPMPQLTAALKTYPVPLTGLVWEMVGFEDPPDQALIAGSPDTMFLFKAASTHVNLRFAEYERGSEQGARREHDVRIDAALFAAFVAGLLGDMLYWAARLRADALTGQQTWRRIQLLLRPPRAAPQPESRTSE